MDNSITALDLSIEKLSDGIVYTIPESENPNYTDIFAGQWFAETFHKCLCWNTTANAWYWYDGVKWQEDQNKVAEKAAENFARAFWLYVVDKGEAFQKVANKLQQLNNRKHLLEDAKKHVAFPMGKFDNHPELFNCQCGTFNTETFQWQDHSYKDYLTKCANVTERQTDYSEDYYKDFTDILDDILPEERAKLLQQVFGLSIAEYTREEKFYICYGFTTRNGKSTILESVSNMMGDYSVTINPETFTAGKNRSGDRPSPDRAEMKGARLLLVSEFEKGSVLDAAYIKRITGGDKIKARECFQRNFDFYLCGQIVMNTNYLPLVNDVTVFTSRRAVVIPFEKHFSDDEQDLGLKDRCKEPKFANQAFYWTLDGLKTFRKKGRLNLPQSVKSATEDYAFDSDKMARFLEECTKENRDGVEKVTILYTVYKEWCKSSGLAPIGKTAFITELKRKQLWSKTGTVDGSTCKNVIKGRTLIDKYQDVLGF